MIISQTQGDRQKIYNIEHLIKAQSAKTQEKLFQNFTMMINKKMTLI